MSRQPEIQTDTSTVLDTIWINHDMRYWQSNVRVVRRDVCHDDATKSYINIELQVGTRWLAMPVWLVPDVIEALKEAKDRAADFDSPTPAPSSP